jgi:hypothetical protein
LLARSLFRLPQTNKYSDEFFGDVEQWH